MGLFEQNPKDETKKRHRRCSVKKVLLKYSGLQLYKQENPTQVFSCEIFKIFKNTYLEKHLQTATSKQKVNLNGFENLMDLLFLLIVPIFSSRDVFNPLVPGVH